MTRDERENKRLLRKYGITLADYYRMFEQLDGGCTICGGKMRIKLNVDHDHLVARGKIECEKFIDEWFAHELVTGRCYVGRTKSEALAAAKKDLLRRSVRGLLCHRCNRGLQMFSDNPGKLRCAADYLVNFRKRLEEEEWRHYKQNKTAQPSAQQPDSTPTSTS